MTTAAAPSPGRPSWSAAGTLYALLMDIFPEHHTESGILNIKKLHTDLGKSHEAVYKWLRSGRTTPKNAVALCNLANSDANLVALRRAKRKPPTVQDFNPFVFVG